jgi:DNA polymerase-1
MTPDRLASIPEWGVSFDFETFKIEPGNLTPKIVCGAVARYKDGRSQGVLLTVERSLDLLETLLLDDRVVLIGANIAFDLACAANERPHLLPLIFAAYVANRIYDVQVAQALDAVGKGYLERMPDGSPIYGEDGKVSKRYSLYICLLIATGRADAKVNDEFRLRYGELYWIPMSMWPITARTYPVDDVCNALDTALAQVGAVPRPMRHRWDGEHCVNCGIEVGYGAMPPCTPRAEPFWNLHEVARRGRIAWALHLGAARGFEVDIEAVCALENTTLLENALGELTELGKWQKEFIDAGILRPDGSQDTGVVKRMVAIAYGAQDPCPTCNGTAKVPSAKTGKPVQCKACGATGFDLKKAKDVPRTPKEGVSTNRDTLFESGHPMLENFAAFGKADKIESTYLPFLREGITEDGKRRAITLKPNHTLASGRVSYSGVVMLLPKKGGVRECIVARDGYYLASNDYEGGELITHAQSCLWLVGHSELAKALVSGVKPHNKLAAQLLGISYDAFNARYKTGDKLYTAARNVSKGGNFGFMGRMGAARFTIQQRKMDTVTVHESGSTWVYDDDGRKVRGYEGMRPCVMIGGAKRCGEVKVLEWNKRPMPPTCKACIECNIELRRAWLATWPENVEYFELVKEIDEANQPIIQHVTKRIRGFDYDKEDPNFGNAIANGFFQALLADASTDALCRVSEECYTVEGPLTGSHVISFQHDEQITEHPIELATEGATRVAVIMKEELQRYCPDLAPAVNVEPAIARRWYKGMQGIVRDGRLVPWEPGMKA